MIDDEQVGRKMTCFAVSEATGAKVQIFKSATGSSSPSSLRRYSVVFSGELKGRKQKTDLAFWHVRSAMVINYTQSYNTER
ncbi:hypothetical protein LXL04_010246 [Taraxacum kok-saghyz]